MASSEWRPTADQQGIAQDRPFTAGGKKQGRLSTRKNALLGTGTPGYVPDESRDPHTYTNPDQPHGRVVGIPDWEYADEPGHRSAKCPSDGRRRTPGRLSDSWMAIARSRTSGPGSLPR